MKRLILYALGVVLLLAFGYGAANWHAEIPRADLESELAQTPSQWLELNGIEVHYRDEGQGQPMLLIHGTSASLHTWNGWVEYLQSNHPGEFRIVRPDLPGFGLTGPGSEEFDYTIPAYVEFVKAFSEALGLEPPIVAGNSLGGEIAWNYAATHPDDVVGLGLINSAGFPRDDDITLAFRMARTPVANKLMTRLTPRSLVRSSLEEVYQRDELITDELVDHYHRLQCRAGNRAALVKRMNAPFEDRTATLAGITAPTAVLWGESDVWIPLSDGEKFAAMIPDAELIRLDAGHVPQEEIPVESVEAFVNFLDSEFPAVAAVDSVSAF